MSQRRTAMIVKFEHYATRSKGYARIWRGTKNRARTSSVPQARLPLRSRLLEKADRLEQLHPELASVIEGLVDDMLDELEGRRP